MLYLPTWNTENYIYIYSKVGICRINVYLSQHMKCITGKFAVHVILINYTTFLQIFVNTSCELLHRHVTKDALPKEFGGNLDSMTSYQSKLYGTSIIGIIDWKPTTPILFVTTGTIPEMQLLFSVFRVSYLFDLLFLMHIQNDINGLLLIYFTIFRPKV
jgi:hypothetical protein